MRRDPLEAAMLLPKGRSRMLVCEPGRLLAPRHLGFVARHRCCIAGCGAHPVHVHHPRVLGTDAAGGRKCSDPFCLPVCFAHHEGQGGIHHAGTENSGWWPAHGVPMPLLIAWRIWGASYRAGHVSDALWGAALPLWRHAANVNAIPAYILREAA